MNNLPFFLSTGISVLCVLLSFLSFGKSQTSNSLQSEILNKQTEIQNLTQFVTLQDQEFKRQGQVVETGATVAQKLGPPILGDMGYFAAKNKNEKLKAILVRQKLDNYIPNADQLKERDKAISEARAKQGLSPKEDPKTPASDAPKLKAPAPAASEPSTPAPAPAPSTPSTPAPTLRPGGNR